MNNEHTHTENLAVLAAKSLSRARPKQAKKTKGKHPGCIYAIVASASQYRADERVRIIDDFVKETRRINKGSRVSTLREFILEAIHEAILKQADKAKRNQRVLQQIEDRETREALGSTFVNDLSGDADNIGLNA